MAGRVSLADYPRMAGETTDDGRFQRALTSIGSSGTLYVPSGIYTVQSSIAPNVSSISNVARSGGLTIVGDNMYSSVIQYTGSEYCFDFTLNQNEVDALWMVNIQIDTTTGGGVKLPQGGQLYFDGFFQNGCASGKWGIYMDGKFQSGYGVYMVEITRSRFWRDASLGGYQGQALYIYDYHTISVSQTFISQTKFNGSIVVIVDGKNCSFRDVAIEGGNPSTTQQTMLEFRGFNSNITLENLYLEGNWNTGIYFDPDGAAKNVNIYGLYAWCYNRKESIALIPGKNDNINIEGLVYKCDSIESSVNVIINDEFNRVRIMDFTNDSWHQNQRKRPMKQKSFQLITDNSLDTVVTKRDKIELAYGQNINTEFWLPTPGTYVVSITVTRNDLNHGSMAYYLVTYDDKVYDFADVQKIGNTVKKGDAPFIPNFNVAVNSQGRVFVNGSGPSPQIWYLYYGYYMLAQTTY
ncbi:hypothetical protein [Paenibacillus sedimenti]|uniref:Pectate lyase superfamily protein domain-containing protein n=1 Tax=Paenibacillus sedimenti TaxID=2770274 RepID=A0A926KL16_9BACL|nr:hypothetical protein [Paenibacillus sedimenti]MBD0379757.1 hypothetical protein [Paenibacillus sedimenti]